MRKMKHKFGNAASNKIPEACSAHVCIAVSKHTLLLRTL